MKTSIVTEGLLFLREDPVTAAAPVVFFLYTDRAGAGSKSLVDLHFLCSLPTDIQSRYIL